MHSCRRVLCFRQHFYLKHLQVIKDKSVNFWFSRPWRGVDWISLQVLILAVTGMKWLCGTVLTEKTTIPGSGRAMGISWQPWGIIGKQSKIKRHNVMLFCELKTELRVRNWSSSRIEDLLSLFTHVSVALSLPTIKKSCHFFSKEYVAVLERIGYI